MHVKATEKKNTLAKPKKFMGTSTLFGPDDVEVSWKQAGIWWVDNVPKG